jgi:hypothetical protein
MSRSPANRSWQTTYPDRNIGSTFWQDFLIDAMSASTAIPKVIFFFVLPLRYTAFWRWSSPFNRPQG